MDHLSLRVIHDEHVALASLLHSMRAMVESGPSNWSGNLLQEKSYFDVLRAMLFYIAEFPETRHHPRESDLLFPRVARMAPETMETIVQLERDHACGEADVRHLQHLLLAWELLGESRRAIFKQEMRRFLDSYLTHMMLEETVILPAAIRVMNEADWKELDAAFVSNCDPLTGNYPIDPGYEELFARISSWTPVPVVGSAG